MHLETTAVGLQAVFRQAGRCSGWCSEDRYTARESEIEKKTKNQKEREKERKREREKERKREIGRATMSDREL